MSTAPEAVTPDGPRPEGLSAGEPSEIPYRPQSPPADGTRGDAPLPLEGDAIDHRDERPHASFIHAPEPRVARQASPQPPIRYGTIVPMLLSNAAGDEEVRRMIMEFMLLGEEANKSQRGKFSEDRGKTEKALAMQRRRADVEQGEAIRANASSAPE